MYRDPVSQFSGARSRGHGHSISRLEYARHQMDVSKNSGTPKSSILIGCSIINHQFWGTLIFGNTQISPLLITFFGFRPFRWDIFVPHPLRHLLATGLKEFELSNAECRNDFDREFIYSGIIQW